VEIPSNLFQHVYLEPLVKDVVRSVVVPKESLATTSPEHVTVLLGSLVWLVTGDVLREHLDRTVKDDVRVDVIIFAITLLENVSVGQVTEEGIAPEVRTLLKCSSPALKHMRNPVL
jgi:hypothetical protein